MGSQTFWRQLVKTGWILNYEVCRILLAFWLVKNLSTIAQVNWRKTALYCVISTQKSGEVPNLSKSSIVVSKKMKKGGIVGQIISLILNLKSWKRHKFAVRSKKGVQDINNKISNIEKSPLSLRITLAIIATKSQPNQVKSCGVNNCSKGILGIKKIDLNQLLWHLRISIVNLIAIIESCVLATSIFRS